MNALILAGAVIAGAGGAVLRHSIDLAIARRTGSGLLGILVINIAGSLLLGVVTGGVLFHGWASAWTSVLGTGLCGGLTTFSTVGVATAQLVRADSPWRGLLNAGGTLAATILAAALALALMAAG